MWVRSCRCRMHALPRNRQGAHRTCPAKERKRTPSGRGQNLALRPQSSGSLSNRKCGGLREGFGSRTLKAPGPRGYSPECSSWGTKGSAGSAERLLEAERLNPYHSLLTAVVGCTSFHDTVFTVAGLHSCKLFQSEQIWVGAKKWSTFESPQLSDPVTQRVDTEIR